MAALAATIPTNSGTVVTPGNVALSDTIARSVMGPKGAYLEIINASGSTDNVVVSDAGLTPAGNALPAAALPLDAVATATSQVYYIRQEQVDPVTNLVTITHSVTSGVTYKLYPVGF